LARAKKTTTKSSPLDKEVLISADEAWNVITFAQELYRTQGVLNPLLINSVMQNITMNPAAATTDKINTALNDPKNSEQQLIGYSEFEELTSKRKCWNV